MPVVAGIDVGNATTEVVLARVGPAGRVEPLAWDRAPTRGRKGSAPAAEAAAALTRRVAGRAGLRVDVAVVAPQVPVDTAVGVRPRAVPPTGRLRLAGGAAATPGRPGWGAGRPELLSSSATGSAGSRDPQPVVLLVPAGTGFERAAALIRERLDGGADVRAVLVADDEGVLVAHRLPVGARSLPVLDGVDVPACAAATRVAVEVRPPGSPVTQLSDPLRLVALLDLPDADRADAVRFARAVADRTSAVVALYAVPPAADDHAGSDRGTADAAPHADEQDRWLVDLDAVAAQVELRRDPQRRFGEAVAVLRGSRSAGGVDPADVVADRLAVPVLRARSETAAAHAGALTSPGSRPDALVLDLGGGTLDAVAAAGAHAVVAGGGELVGAAVAALLGIPRGAAEWVKRGPCLRLEGAGLALGEDGSRTWLDSPAPAAATGSLVVPGPAGWLPFSRELAPPEWRALRLHLKRTALGDNVRRVVGRAVATLGDRPRDVVLVGGVAGDGELLRALDSALDALLPDAVVGRGDVAGVLGHRYAVAHGLVLEAVGDGAVLPG